MKSSLLFLPLVVVVGCVAPVESGSESESVDRHAQSLTGDETWKLLTAEQIAGAKWDAARWSVATDAATTASKEQWPSLSKLLSSDPKQQSMFDDAQARLGKIEVLADVYAQKQDAGSLSSWMAAVKDYSSIYPLNEWRLRMPAGTGPTPLKPDEWRCPQTGPIMLCGRTIDLSRLPATIDGRTFNTCLDVLGWATLIAQDPRQCEIWTPPPPPAPTSPCETQRIVAPFPRFERSGTLSTANGSQVMAQAHDGEHFGFASTGAAIPVPSWARRATINAHLLRADVNAHASSHFFGAGGSATANLSLVASIDGAHPTLRCSRTVLGASASGGWVDSGNFTQSIGERDVACTIDRPAAVAGSFLTLALSGAATEREGTAWARGTLDTATITFCR